MSELEDPSSFRCLN